MQNDGIGDRFMKSLGAFACIPALIAAGVVFVSQAAHAAPTGLSTVKGTGEIQGATVWICLAVFVLGTLGLAFWNSKRREAE
jgi:hypothetical protein